MYQLSACIQCQVSRVCARPMSTSAAAAAVAPAGSFTAAKPVLNAKYNNLPTHHDPLRKVQDKLLFTPGPLTTSYSVKQALTTDLGSRDVAFQQVIRDVRQGLLDVAGVSKEQFTAIPVQGSGTFAIEAVLSSVVDRKRGVLVVANGAYGLRQTAILKAHKIPFHLYECADYEAPDLAALEKLLTTGAAKDVSHVSFVHSETTSGIVNDVHAIGSLAKRLGKRVIVDAMSSFGAYPIDFERAGLDYLVSSANKCIEGVPGFAFAIAKKSTLEEAKGNSSSLALDLYGQCAGLDANGQFRFTPPTHPLIAFAQALRELKTEGGVEARARRYKANQVTLMKGLDALGFKLYLKPEQQGYIISSYHWPTDANWNFEQFYSKLNERSFVIYPGKVSNADCFRIGHIGRIFPEDTEKLVEAITEVCKEMKTAKFAPTQAKL